MHFKQALPYPFKGAFCFILINFLLSLSGTIISPIFPLYLKEFVTNNAQVGYLTSFIGAVLLLSALFSVFLLKKIKRFTLLLVSILIITASYYLFMIITTLSHLLILLFFRTSAVILSFITLGLYVRDSVKKKDNLGKTEGFYFTFLNLAWLLGPLVGGSLAETFSFNFVFAIASFFALIAGIVSLTTIKNHEEQDHDHHDLLANVKDYFKHKNLTLLYIFSAGLAVWWITIYTFLPLFLTEEGISKSVIGTTLFMVAIPLILLEFFTGKLADKYGIKNFFTLGFFILFLFGIITFFTENPIIIIALFVLGCFGAAFVEPLREAYLFKTLRKQDSARFYPVYMTGFDVGHLVGPLLLSSVLLYTNFKAVFLTTAVLMLLFMLTTRLMRDTTNNIQTRKRTTRP
ncbi:MAG TPA: MFS transporter [Candidatus Nanoarchaeia archaeon]|nr:MFS transporter [Candidatus Nanoarchaeia archaeon]